MHFPKLIFELKTWRYNLRKSNAEMEGLIWTMICLRELQCNGIHMETDCSDLVDMIANPTDWPAFTSELVSFRQLRGGFSDFSIDWIPKTRNLRADSLAREARISGVLFFPYRSDSVGQSVSTGCFRTVYHLILKDGRRQKKNLRKSNVKKNNTLHQIFSSIENSSILHKLNSLNNQ